MFEKFIHELLIMNSLADLHFQLWDGKIPIKLIMNPSDIAMNSFVEPHFVLASRYGYLTEISKETTKYFQSKAIEMAPHLWFEADGRELPHHLPLGIIHDISSIGGSKTGTASEEYEPWTITVHFQRPLKTNVNAIPCEDVQRLYFHSLKQALHQIMGTCASFNLLTIDHQNRLWKAANSSDIQEFSTISQIIYPTNPSSDPSEVKQLPVRIIDKLFTIRQKLVRPFAKHLPNTPIKFRTLLEVLEEDFCIIFDVENNPAVVINGIEFDRNSLSLIPAYDFYFVMKHADFYLYVLLLRSD